ncbi:EthD domain-containing protein [Aspergillus tanneri]|uniref:EthD domain-containing protein n=1 Tax=Aspergillus tanneri TaxID=1220188 RepID=A0A5M9MM75_9EURO|nr:uncharacterized protein ATNIH1004_003995 [Aspergillus tanneri]KAA8648112.1 hypothetical protein ATNIH1004_003995 [Aspergillus tanneri]
MTFKVLVYAHRLPGISPEDFKQHYEAHIELFKRLVGDDFPLSHRRVYIARTAVEAAPDGASARNATTPATVVVGQQSDYDYDCLAEMTFADQASWEACVAKAYAPKSVRPVLVPANPESVRTTESVHTTESVRTTESFRTRESVPTTESVRTTESVLTTESVRTTESFRTSESVPTTESVRATKSLRTSESARTIESLRTTESVPTTESKAAALYDQQPSLTHGPQWPTAFYDLQPSVTGSPL